MTFDFDKMAKSKREYRAKLAALPIEEKLAMLDVLRERLVSIRGNTPRSADGPGELKETPTPYRPK